MKRFILKSLVFTLLITALVPSSLADDKIRPEEVIAKHLNSIGPAETRASVKTMLASGTAVVRFRSPATGQLSGKAVLASDGKKSMMGMIFDDSKYSQEKFGFDGQSVLAGYVSPGVRSALADFLLTHKTILKQGLLGGALSTAWPLQALGEKNAKLEYDGTRNVGERTAHKLRYLPRSGSDLEIYLYFDAETFRHVRTEYSRVITAQLGANIDASASQRQTRYKMVEEYSDFKEEGPLTFPHHYKLQLEFDTRGGTYRAEWEVTLAEFAFNQPIPPESFTSIQTQ